MTMSFATQNPFLPRLYHCVKNNLVVVLWHREKILEVSYDPDVRKQGYLMTIELKPEQERIIQEEIRSGHFHSAEEVLDYALAVFREKNSSIDSEPKKSRKNFAQFLMESPLAGSGLDLTRDRDLGRDIEL
jgi:Arc/MetJ-type ribon-helix-helix transcriptional regulator